MAINFKNFKCECCEDELVGSGNMTNVPRHARNFVCSFNCFKILEREEAQLNPQDNYSPSLQDSGTNLGSYQS